MQNRCIVVLSSDDIERDFKLKKISKKLGHNNFIVIDDTAVIMNDSSLQDHFIILDFDVARYEHVELVEFLKARKNSNITFEFLADYIADQDLSIVISSKLRQDIDEFINTLMPIREKISNRFLNPPKLLMEDEFLKFCHHDEEKLYFISNKKLDAGPMQLKLKIDIYGQEASNLCNGIVAPIDSFDQDHDKKFFYAFLFDENTKDFLKGYFLAYEVLRESIETGSFHVKDED